MQSPGHKKSILEQLALSDQDFEQYYLRLMTEQVNQNRPHNLGHSNGVLKCSSCHDPISDPRQLRRYYGRNLHSKCFVELWNREKGSYNNHHLKTYFNRIAELRLGE